MESGSGVFANLERRTVSYPVPHCSTFVMLSCSRLLSQCNSSCLSGSGQSRLKINSFPLSIVV